MKKQIGMTLIELMVTAVILVILLSAAVPSMKGYLENKSLNTLKLTFDKTLTQARSEAVQRGQTVRITPKSSPLPDSNPKDWSNGWDVHLVINASTNELELIRTFYAPKGELVFTSDVFGSDKPLEINPTGRANKKGKFTMNQPGCSRGKQYTYTLMISGQLNRSVVECN